jgi:putative transposase
MCRLLDVIRSAYYEHLQTTRKRKADEKKENIEEQIVSIFQEHRRRYGVRRIVAELQANNIEAGAYYVRKVLKEQGLKAIQPRSFVPRTTDSRHPYPISPNLLLERAAPQKPNEVWVGDITYIPMINGGFLYLAVWMDLYSRKVVSWQLEEHMKEELIVDAFKKASLIRSPKNGMIVHSDRGGQYAGNKFRKLINASKLFQSMSRADNPYDNAFMESCFSRFKAELLQGGAFQNREDAQTEIFEFIEMYYNTKRRHSSLNYQSPMNYENNYYFYKT